MSLVEGPFKICEEKRRAREKSEFGCEFWAGRASPSLRSDSNALGTEAELEKKIQPPSDPARVVSPSIQLLHLPSSHPLIITVLTSNAPPSAKSKEEQSICNSATKDKELSKKTKRCNVAMRDKDTDPLYVSTIE